jgi:shikimate kinase
MDLRLKRTPGLYLVGFMGCGKTTVGRVLAARLGWRFVDIDDEIEAREGVTISEIFDTRGELAFREIEAEVIRSHVRDIARGNPAVVALGGGAFVRQENYELLENHGISIWLDCPLDVLRCRVERATHRPLARDPERFAALFESRRASYNRADFRIASEIDDCDSVVDAILALPIFR